MTPQEDKEYNGRFKWRKKYKGHYMKITKTDIRNLSYWTTMNQNISKARMNKFKD